MYSILLDISENPILTIQTVAIIISAILALGMFWVTKTQILLSRCPHLIPTINEPLVDLSDPQNHNITLLVTNSGDTSALNAMIECSVTQNIQDFNKYSSYWREPTIPAILSNNCEEFIIPIESDYIKQIADTKMNITIKYNNYFGCKFTVSTTFSFKENKLDNKQIYRVQQGRIEHNYSSK